MEQTTTGRMVYCVKLQKELPGLAEVPFDGHPLGQRLPCHHVALDALDRPQAVQLALRAPADQAADRASSRPQGLDDRPAHEAGAARDEHPSHRRLHGP